MGRVTAAFKPRIVRTPPKVQAQKGRRGMLRFNGFLPYSFGSNPWTPTFYQISYTHRNSPSPLGRKGENGSSPGITDSVTSFLDLFHLYHRIHPPLSFSNRILLDRDDRVWMYARSVLSPPEKTGLGVLALKRFSVRDPTIIPTPHVVG